MSTNDADSTPPVDTPVAAPDEAAAPPKRKRAPRKKVVEAAAEPEAAAAPAPAPEPAPVAEPPPPSMEAAPVAMEPAPPAEAGAEPAAEGPAAEGNAEDGPPGEGGRRGRNRRRGRRGGDRARGAAEPGAEGEAQGEGVAAAPAEPRPPAPDVGEVFAQVLSGAFDVEPAPEGEPAEAEPETEAEAPKRVLAAEPDAPKLHKVLAQAGVGSRRDLEQMILEGRITVNGEPAHIGQRISFGDRIAVGGKPVRYRIAPPPPRVLAYHKPAGEVVTHDDPQQRPTVFRRLPRLQQGKWQSVGRLDINTEGLLLFTNSGELANQLMHPRFGVEREYAVRSLGMLGEEAKAQLLEGVEIDGQRCAFKSITDGGGEGANHWYRCVITEGRNREVRKLFEAVGHAVSRLIRIRYGSVVLPRGLKRGVWVDLDEFDVRSLRRIASGPNAERGPRPEGERDGERRGNNNRRGGKRGRGGNAEGPPREAREPRGPRGPRPEGIERGEGGAIPNPLQQTFDKRAIQQERAQRREIPEDGPIPNPLQQTYDKRALQRERRPVRDVPEDGPIPNPLQQTYDKRFAQKNRGLGFGPGGSGAGAGGGGGGGGGRSRNRNNKGGGAAEGGGRQPDPLQTAVGYIGGDAFLRKGGGRGGRSGGGRGGGGGNRGGRGR